MGYCIMKVIFISVLSKALQNNRLHKNSDIEIVYVFK